VLDDEMLTIGDVAAYLKLKPQTIYKWAQAGTIPGAKFGKEWRFRRSAIERWIDSQIAPGEPLPSVSLPAVPLPASVVGVPPAGTETSSARGASPARGDWVEVGAALKVAEKARSAILGHPEGLGSSDGRTDRGVRDRRVRDGGVRDGGVRDGGVRDSELRSGVDRESEGKAAATGKAGASGEPVPGKVGPRKTGPAVLEPKKMGPKKIESEKRAASFAEKIPRRTVSRRGAGSSRFDQRRRGQSPESRGPDSN
jgi:excisionase family DNA binding protein